MWFPHFRWRIIVLRLTYRKGMALLMQVQCTLIQVNLKVSLRAYFIARQFPNQIANPVHITFLQEIVKYSCIAENNLKRSMYYLYKI